MPRARRVCPTTGCPQTITTQQRYCPTHSKDYEQRRGTRQQRGYNRHHDQLRKQWAPKVATGTVDCWRCKTPILVGEAWDLGHDDDHHNEHRGPEHAQCNRSAGGKRAHM